MDFRIADTFTASLARLNGAEQKAVKTTAFDLQLNASAPGLRLHRLDRARDPDFWSVRVNDDIRLIVHRAPTSLMLCYVGHHDAAYEWAERRWDREASGDWRGAARRAARAGRGSVRPPAGVRDGTGEAAAVCGHRS